MVCQYLTASPVYGFYAECSRKFGDVSVWQHFTEAQRELKHAAAGTASAQLSHTAHTKMNAS
eukprot:6249749-Amphidinium_carterae.1